MKIYNKIVLNIFTGETVYEDSFEYEGEVALCGGGKGGGGDDGDQIVTVRYAPYIEAKHSAFLSTVATHRKALTNDSAFDGFTDIVIDAAFFGTGYTIANFPSLYDMYGKFMAGLDVDTLFSQIFEDTVNAPEINDLVAAESDILDDEITNKVLPPILTGSRDINSVLSSTFIIAKSIQGTHKLKS